MTIDEAIIHCEEVANDRAGCCEDCAEEHRQLAEWLKELKHLRNIVAYSTDFHCSVEKAEKMLKVAEEKIRWLEELNDRNTAIRALKNEQTDGSLQKEIDFWHIKCTEYEQTIVKMAVELNNTKSILWSANQTDGDLISKMDLSAEKMAEWIIKIDNEGTYGVCSNCGKGQRVGFLNYCPYCGKRMIKK